MAFNTKAWLAANTLQGLGNGIAKVVTTSMNNSARAAGGHAANAVSKTAQDAQAQYNGEQAALANYLGSQRIAEQYDYNSAQAANANAFTQSMFNQAAEWNERMFQKQMDFNAAEAQKTRDWQEQMRKTAYQTAVQDMKAAGLNPVLAVTGGGISAGGLSGTSASASAPSLSGMSGAMASGGLLNGEKASINNYTGQMEGVGGALGLIGQAMDGLSSAWKAMANMGPTKEIMVKLVGELTKNAEKVDENVEKYGPTVVDNLFGSGNGHYNNILKTAYEAGKEGYKYFKNR